MKNIILFLLALYSINTYSQNQSQSEIAMYNIGLGSICSGIGAVINKKPDEKTGRVFIKGLWQGAIGGYLIYESKNIVSKIQEKESWKYSWPAKIINAAGTSIVENASSNRNFYEQWHLNFGFNRLEFYTKKGFKIKYKIMPISLGLMISTAINNKFELGSTLQRGELIFSNRVLNSNIEFSNGYARGNIIVLREDNLNNYSVFSHELIHVYQYYDYNFVNTYFNKPLKKLNEKSMTFKKINNLIHIDLGAPVLRGLYLIENINQDCYFDNFFEYEAEFFSTNGNVICD